MGKAAFGWMDREGILWATKPDGIDKFRDPRVARFSALEGLGNDRLMGVLASRDGTIWVANRGSLDHIEKNGTIYSIRTGEGLPGNQHGCRLWATVNDGPGTSFHFTLPKCHAGAVDAGVAGV